jgi:hypothetical protein
MNTFVCNFAPKLYHIIFARVKGFRQKTTHLIVTIGGACYKLISKIFAWGWLLGQNWLIIHSCRKRCGIRDNPAVPVFGNKMAKKQFFAILDTETTIENTVADFAIIIVDRAGKIHNQCAVLVNEHYGNFELFHDKKANDIWGYAGLEKRKANYIKMLDNGSRMLASVNAINKWINQAVGKYDPLLTAYNLAFDLDKCQNTGIDLSGFSNKFCLWQAAIGNLCNKKQYRDFVLQNHLFNKPTQHGNMTFSTTAETVCGFINGEFKIEPHTALEDARDFELPILQAVINKRDWREKMTPYNWKQFQVKDHFKAA